jgi:predicted phage terminase large subunit-like protein
LFREKLRRNQIRTNIGDWAWNCGFHPAKHQRFLIKQLHDVVSGKIDRLAVFLPPGSAKSTYCSTLLPSWLSQARPGLAVLAASHTTELAVRFGRRTRNLVASHQQLLGVELAADSQAAGRWECTNGFSYYSAGVDTGIAGFRADLAIIDDPIRSRADAHSETKRDRAWEWYKSDLIPRMRPGSAIILVQTRWHEDDLAGRILAENAKTGERWTVVNIPAQAEANDPIGRAVGEFLWEDDSYGYSTVMRREKATQLPAVWSALYQQRPAPEEGTYFLAGWLKTFDRMPPLDQMRIYGASDFAVTEKGGDYTAHIVVGLDPQGRMHLIDIWRQQASADRWIETMCDLIKRWHPIGWACETGQIKSSVGPFLLRRMRERQTHVAITDYPTRGDKSIRAQSIRARMAIEGLYVNPHDSFYEAFRAELLSFPAGKYDDQVDALGLIGQLLETMVYGDKVERAKKPIVFKDYRAADSVTAGMHHLDKTL